MAACLVKHRIFIFYLNYVCSRSFRNATMVWTYWYRFMDDIWTNVVFFVVERRISLCYVLSFVTDTSVSERRNSTASQENKIESSSCTVYLFIFSFKTQCSAGLSTMDQRYCILLRKIRKYFFFIQQIPVVWGVTPCGLTASYEHFRECFSHLQGRNEWNVWLCLDIIL